MISTLLKSAKIYSLITLCFDLNTSVWAASGTYESSSGNGEWGNEENWLNDIIAGGADFTATLDGANRANDYAYRPRDNWAY